MVMVAEGTLIARDQAKLDTRNPRLVRTIAGRDNRLRPTRDR